MCTLCSEVLPPLRYHHALGSSRISDVLGGLADGVPGTLARETMNGFEIFDHAGSIATTAVLTLGVSEYGTISNSTDQDWFRVNLVAGQTYEFRMLGVGTARLIDPLVRVRDSAGNILALNDDAGPITWGGVHSQDSRLIFTATTTGTFFVEADAFSAGTGTYLLTGVQQTVGGMVFTTDEIAWQLTNAGSAFFGDPEASAFNVGADGQLTVNITNLTAAGQALARAALVTWSDLTGIRFVETNGAAEISFDDSDAGSRAYASTSITGTTINSATVMVTNGWLNDYGTGFNSYSYQTYIHEIGHALGLAHGGNYNGSATFGVDNYYLNDSWAYSIMSYMPADGFGRNTFVNAEFGIMLTPVLADFVAIDRLYGSSTTTRTGNTTYGFNSNTGNARLDAAVGFGAGVNFMVHDNGGIDTLDFSGSSAAQTLNLIADTLSSVLGGVRNLSISRETTIENARGGTGNDRIYGNNSANDIFGNGGNDHLFGGANNDTLNGGTGADTLVGGVGNDTYVTDGGDVITEGVGAGTDAVLSSVTHVLGANLENLVLTGSAAIHGIGNSLANRITGNAANNFLYGGTGVDTLTGAGGADAFVFNTTLGAGNVDRITDFNVVNDTIWLENAIFTGLVGGWLTAAAFRANTTGLAGDPTDRIIYETDTGNLFFDADGTGAGARVYFAVLSPGLFSLTETDFMVF